MNQEKKEKIDRKEKKVLMICTQMVLCTHPCESCTDCENFEVVIVA